MNMDLAFRNIAKCESGAAHEIAWLVICSSTSVLTLSSKQKEVEDLNATLIFNQNNEHAYFLATQ